MTSLEFEVTTFNEKQYGVGNEGHKDYRRELLKDSILNRYKVARLEDLPVYFIPITIEYFEDSDGLVMDRAYRKIEVNDARQNRFVRAGSVFSPFLAFRDFSMKICGADMNVHRHFAENAEVHRRKIGVIVDDFYQKNTVAGNDFWRTVPQFEYRIPDYRWRLSHAGAPLLILGGWLALALGVMVYSYRRIKV